MAVTAVLLKVFKLDIIKGSLSGHPHPLFDIIKEEFQCTEPKSVPVVRAVLHGKRELLRCLSCQPPAPTER